MTVLLYLIVLQIKSLQVLYFSVYKTLPFTAANSLKIKGCLINFRMLGDVHTVLPAHCLFYVKNVLLILGLRLIHGAY